MNVDRFTVRQRIRALLWVFAVAEVSIVAVSIFGQAGSAYVATYVCTMTVVAVLSIRAVVWLANREIDRYVHELDEAGRGEIGQTRES